MVGETQEFVTEAEAYWQSKGWETERNSVDEGVYAVAGARETDSGVEHGLLFVVPDESVNITRGLVSRIRSLAEERNASAAITAKGQYSDTARRTLSDANIETIPPEEIADSGGFNDGITMPDPGASGDGEAGTGGSPVGEGGDASSAASPGAGDGSNSDGRFAGDEQTLEVDMASRLGDNTKHYNTDNIAFFQSVDISVTLFGKLLLYGLPTALALVVLGRFNRPLVAGVVFLVLFLPQWYLMRFRDRAVIGTLSSNDRIASNELDTLEDLFKRSASNLITIAGAKKRLLWHLDYRHHLVPENIVSVQRASRVRGPLYFLGIFVALFVVKMVSGYLPVFGVGGTAPEAAAFQTGVLTLIAYGFEMGYITLPLRFGESVIAKTFQYSVLALVVTVLPGLLRTPRQLQFIASEPRLLAATLAPALLLGLVLGVLLRGTRDAVLVQLQSGVDKVFIMDDDDAERVVSEFQER